MDHFPKDRGENQKALNPPPRDHLSPMIRGEHLKHYWYHHLLKKTLNPPPRFKHTANTEVKHIRHRCKKISRLKIASYYPRSFTYREWTPLKGLRDGWEDDPFPFDGWLISRVELWNFQGGCNSNSKRIPSNTPVKRIPPGIPWKTPTWKELLHKLFPSGSGVCSGKNLGRTLDAQFWIGQKREGGCCLGLRKRTCS